MGRREHGTRGDKGELVHDCLERPKAGSRDDLQFVCSSVSPPTPRPQLTVRLNLNALTQLPVDKVKELCAGALDVEENGWIEVDAAGFAMSESTKMEVVSLASL